MNTQFAQLSYASKKDPLKCAGVCALRCSCFVCITACCLSASMTKMQMAQDMSVPWIQLFLPVTRILPVRDHATAYHCLVATLPCNLTPCSQIHAKLAPLCMAQHIPRRNTFRLLTQHPILYEQTKTIRSAILCCTLYSQ